jgi:hypothetical protein
MVEKPPWIQYDAFGRAPPAARRLANTPSFVSHHSMESIRCSWLVTAAANASAASSWQRHALRCYAMAWYVSVRGDRRRCRGGMYGVCPSDASAFSLGEFPWYWAFRKIRRLALFVALKIPLVCPDFGWQ